MVSVGRTISHHEYIHTCSNVKCDVRLLSNKLLSKLLKSLSRCKIWCLVFTWAIRKWTLWRYNKPSRFFRGKYSFLFFERSLNRWNGTNSFKKIESDLALTLAKIRAGWMTSLSLLKHFIFETVFDKLHSKILESFFWTDGTSDKITHVKLSK